MEPIKKERKKAVRKPKVGMQFKRQKQAAQLIKEAQKGPLSSGKTALLKYLRGEPIGLKAMILAKCASCMCYYVDGRADCEIDTCPLYPAFPYKGKKETIADDTE